MIVFFIIYQLVQIAAIPLVVLYIAFRKINNKPVFGKFSERIGFVPKTHSDHVIWMHAVSVGETLSIQNLIEKIKEIYPSATVYLTVGTIAGKQMAKEKTSADIVSFLPYDFLPNMLIAYKRINPKKMILVEAETWPNLLMLAYWKKIPVYLVNGRISERSKKRQLRFKRFILPLFNLFKKIYAQSEYDKIAFENLGISKDKIFVLGDIKSYNVWEKVNKLKTSNCYKPVINRPFLLAGSTHREEFETYLSLFKYIKVQHPTLQLVVAPRHFHWKKELIQKTAATRYSFSVWDEKNETNWTTDIVLVCKMGELFNLYPLAKIYFLGGTFVPIGGHNLLEPSAWGIPTVIGPYFYNCKTTAEALLERNALIAVSNKKELTTRVSSLLKNEIALKEIGKNAETWLNQEGLKIKEKLTSFLLNL